MITCYLDSQDYSVLTDAKIDSSERRQLRNSLLRFARSGEVNFAFSLFTVSELIATNPAASRLAELKVEFLYDLCGSNALISADRLLESEICSLAKKNADLVQVIDPSGQWFSHFTVDEVEKNCWGAMRDIAGNELIAAGLSRQQRRAAVRKMVKNDQPRGELKAYLARQNPANYAQKVFSQFPLRREYSEVMGRYALGLVSEKEFNVALSNSLKDPRWLMKWFTAQADVSGPVADIVRKPGGEVGELMRKLVELSQGLCLYLAGLDGAQCSDNDEGLIARRWAQLQENQLVGMAQSITSYMKNCDPGDFSAADINFYCPGLSACIGSLYSSMWENIGGGRKEMPSNSQTVDSMHALYAPYVSIFRADRFMSPHIRKHVEEQGTIVVSRLNMLVDAIKARLKIEGKVSSYGAMGLCYAA